MCYVLLILMFSFIFVLASLDPNPISEIDKIINELCAKYKTYVLELDVEYVSFVLFGYYYFHLIFFVFFDIQSTIYLFVRVVLCFLACLVMILVTRLIDKLHWGS